MKVNTFSLLRKFYESPFLLLDTERNLPKGMTARSPSTFKKNLWHLLIIGELLRRLSLLASPSSSSLQWPSFCFQEWLQCCTEMTTGWLFGQWSVSTLEMQLESPYLVSPLPFFLLLLLLLSSVCLTSVQQVSLMFWTREPFWLETSFMLSLSRCTSLCWRVKYGQLYLIISSTLMW